jgi:hypothetical protein
LFDRLVFVDLLLSIDLMLPSLDRDFDFDLSTPEG